MTVHDGTLKHLPLPRYVPGPLLGRNMFESGESCKVPSNRKLMWSSKWCMKKMGRLDQKDYLFCESKLCSASKLWLGGALVSFSSLEMPYVEHPQLAASESGPRPKAVKVCLLLQMVEVMMISAGQPTLSTCKITYQLKVPCKNGILPRKMS